MKKLTLLFTVLFAAFVINAQNVAINNDGSTAAATAMLEVKSTTKGFLMPRMSSAQRTAIVSPALGLLVFDITTNTIWAYNGSSWSNLTSAGGGSLTLPYNQTVNEPGTAFKITNTSGAIQGVSSNISTAALSGSNNSTGGIGVIGSSSAATGIGVSGQSSVGTGIFGLSSDGVGVKASSTNGLALQVNGNVKISGGNTNPSNGAVLTSDANGNAFWKENRIGFSAQGADHNFEALTDIPTNTISVVHFKTENFDYGNDYVLNTSSTPTFGNSIFVAPKTGVYHFDAALSIIDEDGDQIDYNIWLRIRILRVVNGNASIIFGASSAFLRTTTGDDALATISKDIRLLAGDIVNLEVDNTSQYAQKVGILDQNSVSHFGCHLLFEE